MQVGVPGSITLLLLLLTIEGAICLAESPFYPYWPRPLYQAQSFMYLRPLAQNIAVQQAIWHSIAYNKHGRHCAGLQIYPIAQQATATKKN